MRQPSDAGAFERAAMPHLDAAHNLARWLTRRPHDAEDVVQEAFLRAFNGFDRFRGGDARCWLLAIVRNTCHTWLTRNRGRAAAGGAARYDDALHAVASDDTDPEVVLGRRDDREAVRRAVEALPVEFREVIVLREFEGLSYQEIAAVADVPVGTVMSRLSRGRARLERALTPVVRAGGDVAASAADRGGPAGRSDGPAGRPEGGPQ